MVKLGTHIVGAAIAILVAAGPIQAQGTAPKDNMQEQVEKALKESVETIMRALESMVESIPQYEMPEVLENGDIIIRRKKRDDKKKAPDDNSST